MRSLTGTLAIAQQAATEKSADVLCTYGVGNTDIEADVRWMQIALEQYRGYGTIVLNNYDGSYNSTHPDDGDVVKISPGFGAEHSAWPYYYVDTWDWIGKPGQSDLVLGLITKFEVLARAVEDRIGAGVPLLGYIYNEPGDIIGATALTIKGIISDLCSEAGVTLGTSISEDSIIDTKKPYMFVVPVNEPRLDTIIRLLRMTACELILQTDEVKLICLSFDGTHTGANNQATVLTDSTKNFTNLGVAVGDVCKNVTDGSEGIITTVGTTTVTLAEGLTGGTDNDFDTNDVYQIVPGNKYTYQFPQSSDMASNANSGQKDVTVDDGTKFSTKEMVIVGDDSNSEVNYVDSISGNVLTMVNNLASSYTTAANGYVKSEHYLYSEVRGGKAFYPNKYTVVSYRTKLAIDNVSGTFSAGDTLTNSDTSSTAYILEVDGTDLYLIDLGFTPDWNDNDNVTNGSATARCNGVVSYPVSSGSYTYPGVTNTWGTVYELPVDDKQYTAAEMTTMAQAMVERKQRQSKAGTIEVPVNVAQEIWDAVTIDDPWTSKTVTEGRVGRMELRWFPDEAGGYFDMTLGIGGYQEGPERRYIPPEVVEEMPELETPKVVGWDKPDPYNPVRQGVTGLEFYNAAGAGAGGIVIGSDTVPTFTTGLRIGRNQPLSTTNKDGDWVDIKARDNGVGLVDVARIQSAGEPRFVNKVFTHDVLLSVEISSGAIDITGMMSSFIEVEVEGGSGSGADELDTITGGNTGDIVILRPYDTGASDTVTVKNGTGNIHCGADRALNHVADRIVIQKYQTDWYQLGFNSNS